MLVASCVNVYDSLIKKPYFQQITIEHKRMFLYNKKYNMLKGGYRMINDRGTIKWTSMMLPEHANMLKEMWSQKEWKEKPMLDEQLITEMNLKLQFALKDDLTIEIEYFKDHDYHKIKGKLLGVNPLLNYIKIEDMELPLDAITGVWID